MEHRIDTGQATYLAHSCDPCEDQVGHRVTNAPLATRLSVNTLDGPKDLCDDHYQAFLCRDCARVVLRADLARGGCPCGGRIRKLVA